MSIKFQGKPPFYLGIAEVASAHALDGSVVLRATISVPELRPGEKCGGLAPHATGAERRLAFAVAFSIAIIQRADTSTRTGENPDRAVLSVVGIVSAEIAGVLVLILILILVS
jgi:hypothetical protein